MKHLSDRFVNFCWLEMKYRSKVLVHLHMVVPCNYWSCLPRNNRGGTKTTTEVKTKDAVN